MSVELVAYVDQVLHRCDVNVVDRPKVEDDALERWTVVNTRFRVASLSASWAGVVPGTVTGVSVVRLVCCARDLEDVRNEILGVVGSVGIDETCTKLVSICSKLARKLSDIPSENL